MSYPAVPRIPPLPPGEWSREAREILEADLGESSPLGASRLSDLNLFTTTARLAHPFKPWLLLGRALLMNGSLPFADRELIILRVGFNHGSPYEWGQHVKIAIEGGIPREDVDRVPAGPEAPGWEKRTRLLLRAVDELHHESRIGEETWAALSDHLDERQLIELPMLVGYYAMVAFTLNSLAIQPEDWLEPFPR